MSERKVAIVTGGNKGIGYAVVKGLCEKFNGDVFLTSRDIDRGTKAVKSLNELGLYPKYHQLDVTDEASITKFRDFLKTEYGEIDILVNNAAIAIHPESKTPFSEEAKETLKVNYFGLRKVCNLLFPLLRPHARVVNVSSSAGHLSHIPGKTLKQKLSSPSLTEKELDDLMLEFLKLAQENKQEEHGWPSASSLYCAYIVSKVAVSALSIIQQRKLLEDATKPDIIVNHVHPGYVDTDMTQHKGPLTVEQGAEAPLFAALIPENANEPKGQYIWHTKEIVDWVNGPMPGRY